MKFTSDCFLQQTSAEARKVSVMKLGHHAQTFVDLMIQFTPEVFAANGQELLCKNGAADGLAHQRGITAREDRNQAVVTPFTDGAMALIEMSGAKKDGVAHKATTIKRSTAQIQIEINRPVRMPLDGVKSSAGQSQKEGGRFMSRFPYEGHATIRREHV